MVKKFDIVELVRHCDSPFLFLGDKGQVFSDILGYDDEEYVAVSFDKDFEEHHDCEGLVTDGYGWFVSIYCLKVIK